MTHKRFRRLTRNERRKLKRRRFACGGIVDGAITSSQIYEGSILKQFYQPWYADKAASKILDDWNHTCKEIEPGVFEHTYTAPMDSNLEGMP